MTEQKLKLAEQARDEFQKMMEELKKTLEIKEKEVRQARKAAMLEYRDSDALIAELEVSYNVHGVLGGQCSAQRGVVGRVVA